MFFHCSLILICCVEKYLQYYFSIKQSFQLILSLEQIEQETHGFNNPYRQKVDKMRGVKNVSHRISMY